MVGNYYSNETNSNIISKYNVSRQAATDAVKFKDFFSITYNSDGKAALLEKDNVLYYCDIRSSEPEPVKLLEGYDYLKAKNINHDNTSVLYTEEAKTYFALYNKNKLIFRRKLDLGSDTYQVAISSNKNDQIIYVEDNRSNKVSLYQVIKV